MMNNFGPACSIWILLVSLISYCERICATNDEDLFVEAYGNHNVSGIWRYVRDKRESATELKAICAEVHACAAKYGGKVGAAVFDTRMLEFECVKYEAMRIDVLIYALAGDLPEGAPTFFYITKGRTSECVHYLVPNNATEAWFLALGEHVCGIDLEKVQI